MSEKDWLKMHKDEIDNINNMVEDLDKNKKVQKIVEVFSRWQDPTIEQLQQENKQLKEVVAEVKEFVDCYLSTYENADEQVLYLDANDISKLLQILNKEIL